MKPTAADTGWLHEGEPLLIDPKDVAGCWSFNLAALLYARGEVFVDTPRPGQLYDYHLAQAYLDFMHNGDITKPARGAAPPHTPREQAA